MEPRQAAPPGTMVYGADGEPMGTVQTTETNYLVVDTGDIPPALYVPVGAIVESREDGIYLSATRADAASQGWGDAPAEESGTLVDENVEAASDYTAIQGEDSLDDDPMPTPGDAHR